MSGMTAPLLKRIDAYLKRSGMSESAFSHAIQKNGLLLKRLREGRGVHSKTVDRIEALIGSRPPRKPAVKGRGK